MILTLTIALAAVWLLGGMITITHTINLEGRLSKHERVICYFIWPIIVLLEWCQDAATPDDKPPIIVYAAGNNTMCDGTRELIRKHLGRSRLFTGWKPGDQVLHDTVYLTDYEEHSDMAAVDVLLAVGEDKGA